MTTTQLKESRLTYDVYDKYAAIVQKRHISVMARKNGQDQVNWFHQSLGYKVASIYKKDGKLIFEMK